MLDRALFALPKIKETLALLVLSCSLRATLIAGQAYSLASALVNLWEGASISDQFTWLCLFAVCFIGRQIVVLAQDTLLDTFALSRANELRQALLDRIFTGGAQVVQEQGTGKVATLVVEGIDQVETYIRLIVPKTVAVVVVPFVLLLWIAPLDWVSGLIAIIAFPFIILYMVILGHTAQDEAAKQHATFQILSNTFIDALRGIDTLKLFGRGKSYGSAIYEASERFRVATMKTLQVAQLSGAVLDLFATGALAAVAIMLGFRLVDETIVFFPALAVLIMVPEYFRPVREFASDYHASLDGKNALVSVLDIIGADSENLNEKLASYAEATQKCSDNERNNREQSQTSSLCVRENSEDCTPTQVTSDIPQIDEETSWAMNQVSFEYIGYEALTHLNLNVQGCVRVGIVGESGAGKSTLINLLGGFAAPSEGTFTIGGTTTDSLSISSWQRQVAYIPQQPYVFHATLRDNLVFYTPDAPDDLVHEAIEVVGLEDLVAELPDGLSTVIGDGARPLSGGQAQRIALARAFLDSKRSVLLFDEPTAHLDIETEWELKQRMLPLMNDKLVFFATHRLHWMDSMDVVVVLERGRIVQVGKPYELRNEKGPFKELVETLGGELV